MEDISNIQRSFDHARVHVIEPSLTKSHTDESPKDNYSPMGHSSNNLVDIATVLRLMHDNYMALSANPSMAEEARELAMRSSLMIEDWYISRPMSDVATCDSASSLDPAGFNASLDSASFETPRKSGVNVSYGFDHYSASPSVRKAASFETPFKSAGNFSYDPSYFSVSPSLRKTDSFNSLKSVGNIPSSPAPNLYSPSVRKGTSFSSTNSAGPGASCIPEASVTPGGSSKRTAHTLRTSITH